MATSSESEILWGQKTGSEIFFPCFQFVSLGEEGWESLIWEFRSDKTILFLITLGSFKNLHSLRVAQRMNQICMGHKSLIITVYVEKACCATFPHSIRTLHPWITRSNSCNSEVSQLWIITLYIKRHCQLVLGPDFMYSVCFKNGKNWRWIEGSVFFHYVKSKRVVGIYQIFLYMSMMITQRTVIVHEIKMKWIGVS